MLCGPREIVNFPSLLLKHSFLLSRSPFLTLLGALRKLERLESQGHYPGGGGWVGEWEGGESGGGVEREQGWGRGTMMSTVESRGCLWVRL